MKNKKIVCIVSHCPDSLINKRIQMLKNEYDVTIVYNERGNENFSKLEDVKYIKLSLKFNNGQLIKRVFYLIKLKKEIKQIIKNEEPDVIYAFRLDMLLLTLTKNSKNKKIIYEVADLHKVIINDTKHIIKKLVKRILISVEKKACKQVDLLSITSEKYYDVYFNKMIDKTKVVFMPNMPDLQCFQNYKKKNHEDFTIGFIGYVRYKKQMKLLIQASKQEKTKVLFAGDSQDDEIKQLTKECNNIEYYGKYDYNKEIADLYEKCDCIYSIYDISYNNVKYALPNKLYEAIYCELPILVAQDTYLGEIVEKWGVGLTVDSTSLEDLIKKINLLKEDKELYQKLAENCKKNKEKININIYNNIFMGKLKQMESRRIYD